MAPDQRSRWFDDITQRQRQIPFAIEDESGEMIGRIFLRHVRHEERSAVLGIDLHPAYLGGGYGTESLGAFLHHYFENMAFERMLLSVAAHNVRARRSYESLGFMTVGSHWDAHIGPDVSGEPQFAVRAPPVQARPARAREPVLRHAARARRVAQSASDAG